MALATIIELAARLPFVMDEDDEREATGAIEDLSNDALRYGNSRWTEATAPEAVKNLILRAATRHMKNYEGYTESRAGDETVKWADRGEAAGTATFTEDEKNALRGLANKGTFIGTVPVVAWGASDRDIRRNVPVSYGGKDFPLYSHEDDHR